MKLLDKPDPKDTANLHILRAPWGVGTYRIRFEDGTEDMQYGFYRTENPHDFYPDHECCSEQEIANHKAACDWWDSTHPKPKVRTTPEVCDHDRCQVCCVHEYDSGEGGHCLNCGHLEDDKPTPCPEGFER